MKNIITAFILLLSLSSCAQDTAKHVDAIIIRSYYDTIKVKMYYEDGKDLKIYYNGFEVRLIETSTAPGTQPKLISALFFDKKMRPFKKTVFNIFAR